MPRSPHPQGDRHFKGVWFYDALDTIMAHDVRLEDKVIKKRKREDKSFSGTAARTMPCELSDQQQRLWLASEGDNKCYSTVYSLDCIDE